MPTQPALRLATARFRDRRRHDRPWRLLDPALIDALPAIRELRPEQGGRSAPSGLDFTRGGDWLFSGDPGAPVVGDVRVRFAVAPEGVISLVASARSATGWSRSRQPPAAASRSSPTARFRPRRCCTSRHAVQWREAWQLRGFAAMAVLIGTLFAMPELTARFAASPLFASRRRIRTMLLLAAGAAAGVCAISWLGARLLLWLVTLAG